MDDNTICPLMGRPCGVACAWYDADDDAQSCAVLSIAKSLGRVAFEFDERDSLLISALNRIGDEIFNTI